jgi:uncharacterized Zn-binding protein involved in type VI secretion
VGQTLESTVDTTTLVVVRCPDQDVTVTCGGRPMAPRGEITVKTAPVATGDGTLLGKRYTVDAMDIELLCVGTGSSPVAVDGTEVAVKSAKPLPASD